MTVRKAFEDTWEAKFPETPVPTNLSFLDDEGVSSLAAALDKTERMMKKLGDELERQQFIHDFVLERLNVSLAARSDYASWRSVSPSRQKMSISKTPSAPRGQSTRARSKPSQLAAVMAKIGIGKVNRPAIDPEDEGRVQSLDDGSKKATPLSRFYEKSNMYRASSEPSLVDCDRKFKPQPAIPPTTTSRTPPGFKPVFTKDERSNTLSTHTAVNSLCRQPVSLRKSTGSELDYGRHKHTEEPVIRSEVYLETDLDSIVPPVLTPSPVASQLLDVCDSADTMQAPVPPPLPPPPVERVKLDVSDSTGPGRPPRAHNLIYEEPVMEFCREITSRDIEAESAEDEDVSSDEEPIYFNIRLFNQQTLNRANALYTSGAELSSSSSVENKRSPATLRRLRRMAHHYEYIEPQITKSLSIYADSDSGK